MSAAPLVHQAPGQPQSKAAPTAKLTVPTASQEPHTGPADDGTATVRTTDDVRRRPVRPLKENGPNDPASLPATLQLIQRVLTPYKPALSDPAVSAAVIEDILPPLTSSNEVDVELYAILAIIVKDFINTWYTKITPDNAFVGEVIQIVAHCSRALEQRLRRVDIPALFLDEIPSLVKHHIDAFRTAKSHSDSSPYDLSVRRLYHELRPHSALSPLPLDHDPASVRHQADNERAYRQLLVHGSLAVLLPTEDLQNGPLRLLVGDIIADLILGQALAGKLCEGWFLHDAIFKVTAILSDKVQSKASGTEIRDDAKNRLEKFGLLTHDPNSQHNHSPSRDQSAVITWFWKLMQYGYLAFLFMLYVGKELQFARSKPKRQYHVRGSSSSSFTSDKSHTSATVLHDEPPRPVLAYRLYAMISTLLQTANRMPWITGILSFWQQVLLYGAGRVGGSNSTLDRFLYHGIETHMIPSSLLPMVLRNLRIALFPKNSLGPPAPPTPTPEERVEIRRRAASSILDLMPAFAARTYYATRDQDRITGAIEQDMLEPLSDLYLNRHLVYSVLELVLVRLIPELGGQSVSALLTERGVMWADVSGAEESDSKFHDALGEQV